MSHLANLEKARLDLGFMPLTDCAPLILAQELGLFANHGLEVSLHREISWSNIRDKLALGVFDAAQMLAPMVIAGSLGLSPLGRPTLTALSLDLNGNAITVSEALFRELAPHSGTSPRPMSVGPLREVIESHRAAGQPPLVFATVFPYSMHHYLLRYWLAAGGIDPDADLQLIVIPPSQMVSHLRDGHIDGYCVGEPWNATAVKEGIGRTLLTSYDIWNNAPEKVLGVNQAWAEQYPRTHLALVTAVLEAMRWLDEPANRPQAASIVARSEYVDAPAEIVRMSLLGTYQFARNEFPRSCPDFNVFHRYMAGFPWRSHAVWQLTQMIRWGQVRDPVDLHAVAAAVYRPDIYRQAAASLGMAAPDYDYKLEGGHDAGWWLDQPGAVIALGADRFLDGASFDPGDPVAYLDASLSPTRDVDLVTLARLNPGWSPDEHHLRIAPEYQSAASIQSRS